MARPRLLRQLPATWLVAGFPLASLGGHDRGMANHYRHQFLTLADQCGWKVEEIACPVELLFVGCRRR